MYSGITSGRVLNGELLYTKKKRQEIHIYIYLFRDKIYNQTTVLMSSEMFLQNSSENRCRKITFGNV